MGRPYKRIPVETDPLPSYLADERAMCPVCGSRDFASPVGLKRVRMVFHCDPCGVNFIRPIEPELIGTSGGLVRMLRGGSVRRVAV